MDEKEETRQLRKFNLEAIKPSGVSQKPKAADVKVVAERQAFTSREGNASTDVSIAVASIKRRPGARKKGRTESFNTRLKPETFNRIIEINEINEWGYAEFIEHAVKQYDQTDS
ncbi:MAG: hypothetical protein GY845_37280 [Planctomycetes bacterium]|nr:hypothetical protein [Planctomycetota bacterium]